MSITPYRHAKDQTKKQRTEQIWQRMASLRKQQMERINEQATALAHQAQTIGEQSKWLKILRICLSASVLGFIVSIITRLK